MKAICAVLLAMGLIGCASAPVPKSAPATQLFADHLFAGSPLVIDPQQIFALSPAMRNFLDEKISVQVREHGPRRGLLESLKGELRIEYDSARTRNAAETFDARSGNCLSLVLMTSALARELGISVVYRNVYGYDTWTRTGGMAFHSGHINLVLGHPLPDRIRAGSLEQSMVVDFLPTDRAQQAAVREIPEAMVVAMYLNNRAAEMLAQGDVDGAYWWARASAEAFPLFTTAWNTLAVIYMRHGNLAEAEQALQHALALEPDGLEELNNLATVFTRQGRDAEAQALRARVAAMEPIAPFFYFDLGLAAMERGEFSDAIAMFERERSMRPYADEVHFALAVARLRQGDPQRARKHLSLALANSTTPETHAIYAAKLDYLKDLRLR